MILWGHIHVLPGKFTNGKGCIKPLRWILFNSYWVEIKAVFDHFQNFVWSQHRGLYVTLASMWALGSEPSGLKLYISMKNSRVTIYLGLKCHILIDLLNFKILSLNPLLSMRVCKTTIRDCKKKYFNFDHTYLGIPNVKPIRGIPCDGKPNFKRPPSGPGARPHGNFCGAS
jgi:hypothetical protein